MRTVAVHTQAIHERVEALRVTISAGLRYAPCVLLALLVGVLNPALCVLHCFLTHGPQAAQATPLGHAHHSHNSSSHGGAHDHGACAAAGLPETAQLTPRAGYELVPVALALVALVLAAVARTPGAPWPRPAAQSPQPLTPPPKTLAFS